MYLIKFKIYKINQNKQWRLQFQLNKKRIRKNFRIKRDAIDYINEVQKNFSQSNLSDQPLSKVCDSYLKQYPESHLIKTKWIYNDFIKIFGHLLPVQISSSMLQEWLLNKNISSKSRANYKCNLNAIFKYLVLNKVLVESPFEAVSFYPYKTSKKVLDDTYFEALWIYSPYFLYRVIWIEYHIGLSRKAVLDLKWSDSFEGFDCKILLFISMLPKRGEYILVNRKGKKIDRNLVIKKMKIFEEKWQGLKKPVASHCGKSS